MMGDFTDGRYDTYFLTKDTPSFRTSELIRHGASAIIVMTFSCLGTRSGLSNRRQFN